MQKRMLPQPMDVLQLSPEFLLILPRFSYLCHAFHMQPLALELSFPLWVSTERVLGKAAVNMPLAFPSSTHFH